MKKDYENRKDEQLIEAFRAKDAEAGDFLMNKYKEKVRRKARRLFIAGGDEEDLLQEGMWGLFKAIREYDPAGGASFSTFADVCIRNQMLTAIRTANSQKYAALNESLSLSASETEHSMATAVIYPDPETLFLQEEEEMLLREKIRKNLSPLERQVLDLYLKGMDYREIGATLQKSDKSMDNALQRIRRKVREELKTGAER